MALELVYTSAERGLRAGTSGFCTVAMSRALPPALVPRLEALGGYRPGPNGDGPVARSFWRIDMAGGVAHVLSIVGPAPPDHTQRTNKIATYLVLGQDELDDAGPAWMLAQPGAVRTAWSGAPTWFEQPARAPSGGPAGLQRASAWEAACGDAGWAGVLASAFLRDQSKPAHVIVPAGLDPLPLVDDAMRLLPPWARWRATFTTYFLQPVAGVQCAWRFCVDGTPGAEQARQSKGLVIDLAHPIGQAPDSRYVRMARTGTDPEGDAEAARQRRDREARAAAERARAAQIRVVADPKGAAHAPAPRTPVTPRGLPIEVEELRAPDPVLLSRGVKIALGVGGGVLVLAVVAVLALQISESRKPAVVAPGPSPAADQAAPSERINAPGTGQAEGRPPKAPAAVPQQAAPADWTQKQADAPPSAGPSAEAGVETNAASQPRTPDANKQPTDERSTPSDPPFPSTVATSFAVTTQDPLERGRFVWKSKWSGALPRFETAKIKVPEFMEGIVADEGQANKSRVVMIGAMPTITLESSAGAARLEGNEVKLPDALPWDWLPASAASTLTPGEWLRLVVRRLLVVDGDQLFQPKPALAETLGAGERLLPDVIDPAVWVEIPGEWTTGGKTIRARAVRQSNSSVKRSVDVELSKGHLKVELVDGRIEARIAFAPKQWSGDTPADLLARLKSAKESTEGLAAELKVVDSALDGMRSGRQRKGMSIAQGNLLLEQLCQQMKERELEMLVDSNGKPVGFDRKADGPGNQTRIVLKLPIPSVHGWANALESMRTRRQRDLEDARRNVEELVREKRELDERLATPVGAFAILGDDGYVIANVTLLPAQPPAASAKGGANP